MDEEPGLTSRIGLLRPMRHRDFRLLWIGQTVSMVGDGTYYVAVAWLVYQDLGRSAAAFAAVGVAWSLPQLLLLLASGALSDRMDRRHLMIAGDLLRLEDVVGVELGEDDAVVVRARNPRRFFRDFTGLVLEEAYEVRHLETLDDSAAAILSYLLGARR